MSIPGSDRPKTFEEIKSAVIDDEGTFKYIQINFTDNVLNKSRTVVRGYKSCGYHADVLAKFEYEELS